MKTRNIGICKICNDPKTIVAKGICSSCYRNIKPKNICPMCGRTKYLTSVSPETGSNICYNCYRKIKYTEKCSDCNKRKTLTQRNPNTGRLICSNCYKKIKHFGQCPLCKGSHILQYKADDVRGNICQNCSLKRKIGLCPRCLSSKPLVWISPFNKDHICRDCWRAIRKTLEISKEYVKELKKSHMPRQLCHCCKKKRLLAFKIPFQSEQSTIIHLVCQSCFVLFCSNLPNYKLLYDQFS